MWAWILAFIYVLAGMFFYSWMIAGGIPAGTSTDLIVRRCIFPFLFMLIAGFLNFFSAHSSQSTDWVGKRPLLLGTGSMLFIELYGLFRLMTESDAKSQPSAILHNWMSHWWIIILALSLGALGAYSGSRLAQKWHKKSVS